ncbi:MAG: Fe(3+) ABC transporter substrate-binding protein, partial [Acidobacteria bacterium]
GGVVAGATNRDNAVRLLEFLAGPEAQSALVAETREYPVAAGYEAVPELEAFGAFDEDPLNASVLGDGGAAALRLTDRCGWR